MPDHLHEAADDQPADDHPADGQRPAYEPADDHLAGDQPADGPVAVTIEKVVAGGDGLARAEDGRAVFVGGGLPGERVVVRFTERKRDFARARIAAMIEPNAGRIEPPCPYVAAGCGGCTWQHATPELQREMKRAIVIEALTRTGGLVDPVVTSGAVLDPFGFRTTLRLGVDRNGRAGLRGRRSHDIVPVEHCLVAHPLLDELVNVGRFAPGTDVTLRCSVATGERTVLVEQPAESRRRPSPGGGGPPKPTGLPPKVRVGRDAALREVVGGARLRVSTRSFFQTRHDGAEALVDAVRRAAVGVDPDGLMVDAYGGVGLFAATIAPHAPLVLIESSWSSCADAAVNLADRAADIVEAQVEEWSPRSAALVVADPSRSGLGREATDVLAACEAPVLVLVSCDPVSLARDARLLAGHGYAHHGSEVIDLFPHTSHVEVVTRFELR